MLRLLLWLGLIGIGIGLIVEFLKLLMDFFLAIWPVLLVIIAAVFACWLLIMFFRNRKKRIAEETSLPDVCHSDFRASVISDLIVETEEQLNHFDDSYELIRSFYTKVVGVSYANDDGTDRQEILSYCKAGEQVDLDWGTFNEEPACAVVSNYGQIGFLRSELAADLHRDYIDGYEESNVFLILAQIGNITGGNDGLHYGCNIKLSIYGLSSPYRDEMLPVAVEIILEAGKASVTQLQKQLHIGYSRASRLMDELEENGIVGPFQGSKPRSVLITRQEWDLKKKQ